MATAVRNEQFLSQIQKRFPDKEKARLLVSDANGRSGGEVSFCATLADGNNSLLLTGCMCPQEALEMLDQAGYVNLVRLCAPRCLGRTTDPTIVIMQVGMIGGFAAFSKVFDAKLARRASRGAFVENPLAKGSSQGAFAGES